MVFDEAWRDTLPSPQGPPIPEDDIYDDTDWEDDSPPIAQAPGATTEENPETIEAPTRDSGAQTETKLRKIPSPNSDIIITFGIFRPRANHYYSNREAHALLRSLFDY